MRLADAFARFGRGSLTFVGDGPLRGALEGRERVRVVGKIAHDRVPGWLSAADVVCGPAHIEPFGQALLEAMACARTVVATRIGGPPEFVTDGAGILVDPLDTGEMARALETAAAMPSPNSAAREAASRTTSGSRWAGWRRSSSGRFETGQPDLDERPHCVPEPVLAGKCERLLVARAHLVVRDALLQAVVAGQEQVVDLCASLRLVHRREATIPRSCCRSSPSSTCCSRSRWSA